jgi:aminopeptidase N/puromycin-sensitive aminopeptidase
MSAAERIRLLSDEWAALRVGRQSIDDYLNFAEEITSETNGAVMEEFVAQLQYIGDYLIADADRKSYQQWVATLLSSTAQQLGWQPGSDESDDRKRLRAQVLFTLGYIARDSLVLAKAARLAQLELRTPGTVDPTIVSTVLELSAVNGNTSLYNQIVDRMKTASSPEEYSILMGTLSRFSDPSLLQRTLQFSLAPEVRAHDVHVLITGVMENPAGRQLAWKFVRDHWTEIEKSQGTFNTEQLVEPMGSFCDAGLLSEMREFFTRNPVPAADRAIQLAVERASYCIDLKSQQALRLSSWLDRRESTAGK